LDLRPVLDLFKDLKGRNIVAFRIRDNSMEPRYAEGDVVLCDVDAAPAEGSRVMAKVRNREIVCRTWYPRDDFVQLVAANPNTPPELCARSEIEWIYPIIKSISD
jgi:phage repressor protein C with HTH and peptisase S24 domain